MSCIDGNEFFGASAIDDPYSLYDRMRAQAPVCRIGETRAFLAGTQVAVEEAVRRHSVFSAHLRAMLVCGADDKPTILDLDALGATSTVIANADEPVHAVHRKLMLPPLKAARIAALEPELRTFARQRVASLRQAGGGDVCPILAEALPAYVVIRLLGMGDQALEAVRRWAMMGGDFLAGRLPPAQMDAVFVESLALHEFLATHFDAVATRAPALRGESLTATLAGGVEEGLITRDEAIGILMVLFGAAGESTASLLGSAVRLLAMDDALQARLRSQPALVANFIEEVVRLESPFKFHYRYVLADTSLCGTPLKAGDLLLLGWASANRDPAALDQPGTLRLDRERPERHLGFGYGIHYCIGAPLARLEVRVALEELLSGTRHITLDATDPYAFVPSIFVRRVAHLKVRVS